MTKWNKLRSLIKEQGLLKSIWLALRYVLRNTIRLDWRKYIIFERSIAEPILESKPKISVAVKQARKEDLEKFVSVVSAKKYREFQRRINNGRICFMVLDGDKAIGYSWISLDDEYIPDGGVDVVLGEKEAFLFDDYILPQYRGKGLQSALIPPRLAYLREHGYLVGLSYIHDVNTVAMKAPVTAGFMPKRTVSVFMISGMKIRRLREFSGNLPVTK